MAQPAARQPRPPHPATVPAPTPRRGSYTKISGAGRPSRGPEPNSYFQGWLVSAFLHGMLVLAAIVLVKQAKLPSPSQPFHWNISLVSSLEPDTKPVPTQAPPSPVEPVDPGMMDTSLPTTKTAPTSHSSGTISELYQAVGPDGSISFTNVPSDSRSHKMVTDESRISTIHTPFAQMPATSTRSGEDTYSWLWGAINRRLAQHFDQEVCYRWSLEELGTVVLQFVIHNDGTITDVQVLRSSGFTTLDHNWMTALRQMGYVVLPQALEQSAIRIQSPFSVQKKTLSYQPPVCRRS